MNFCISQFRKNAKKSLEKNEPGSGRQTKIFSILLQICVKNYYVKRFISLIQIIWTVFKADIYLFTTIPFQMIRLLLTIIRICWSIGHFKLVHSFVNSKPPGRKMVNLYKQCMHLKVSFVSKQITADINVWAYFIMDVGIISQSIEWLIFIVFGHLSFTTIFVFRWNQSILK